MESEIQSWRDEVAELLAGFALAARSADTDLEGARKVLIDTLAVGFGAFDHPAARIARSYLEHFPSQQDGVVIWGTARRAPPDKATLVNGVLLRCYDYNDVLVGSLGGGHPSDMVAALLSVADWRGSSGRDLLTALAVGYEVAAALYDVVPAEAVGWDHANVSALGAVAGAARLLGLSADQAAEAFGIAAIQHIQSNEIESSAVNRRGDLTMWKRFHGADIMRHALDACLLALSGAEGAVRPFQGKLGFLAIFGAEGDPLPLLRERLRPDNPMLATTRTDMKRWPVGSRGQSAIRATIEARRKMPDGARIAAVRVATEEAVYDHLVRIRTDPWRAQSRETADHSLPYIVGTAALDGFVNVSSFDLEKVHDGDRARFIAEKVAIEVDPTLTAAGAGTSRNTSRVEIVTEDGEIYSGAPLPGPGHHDNPFSIGDLSEKFHENADDILGHHRVDHIISAISCLDKMNSIRDLTNQFAIE